MTITISPHYFKRLYSVIALLLVGMMTSSVSQAQTNCNLQLLDATTIYNLGFFNRVIDQLDQCSKKDFTSEESAIEAFRLIAISYIALDQEERSLEWIQQIVNIDKNYTPAPEAPLFFREYVNQLKPKKRPALFTSLGFGVIGAASAFLLLRSPANSDDPLPGPISLPNQ